MTKTGWTQWTQSIKGQMCVKSVPLKNTKSSAQNAQNKFRTILGRKQRKIPEFLRIQDFSSQTEFSVGGDKRDRTADLLNAMAHVK